MQPEKIAQLIKQAFTEVKKNKDQRLDRDELFQFFIKLEDLGVMRRIGAELYEKFYDFLCQEKSRFKGKFRIQIIEGLVERIIKQR